MDAGSAPGCAGPSCGAAKGLMTESSRSGGTHRYVETGSDNWPAAVRATVKVVERHLVSVLFTELVGLTTLAEGREAEDARELLSQYVNLSREVVTRYGGTIEKRIGDAVTAVWGATTAREDDAERAVRAALELVDAVRWLGPRIAARVGVVTGEAAIPLDAANQGTAVGDLVDTASRLQSVAAPGTVLVGEATQRAACRAIGFEPAGEQALNGKVAPVPAWRALRVVAGRGGRRPSETLEAPFVGRDDELRQLKDLFHATRREWRPRLVSVIGPAGSGKTRLADEFRKYLDGFVESVCYDHGRSPAFSEGNFWALAEIIRRRAGLLETDDEPTTRNKVAETLARHVPDPDERRWIEPALLALVGIESGVRSEQLFGAWRTFFERIALVAPVVLVFEDYHHADAGLLDFVDHLFEWSRDYPIYVVTLARPELLEKRPACGAGRRNFTSIYLEPLPEASMGELLAGLVPGLPTPAVKAIIVRADGIPLYAVEAVRMLVADGWLAIDGETHRSVSDLTVLSVPETLTALIAAQLDALATKDRALISAAAVLGQSFTLAGLSAVSGIAEARLEPRLQALVRRDLLALDTNPRSPKRGQYAFVQGLTREVAYDTLAKASRSVCHLAAARFFADLGSDELAGAVAVHYRAAHENVPDGPRSDALAAETRIAIRTSAERAIAIGSPEQAVILLRQALAITTDPEEQVKLLEMAGESASAASHHEDAEAVLRRAVGLHRDRGDWAATARATAALGKALAAAHRNEAALAVLEPAAGEFADLATDPAFLALLGELAGVYVLTGQAERAIAVADRALPAAERADLTELVADLLVMKAEALGNLGRTDEGYGTIETAMQMAEAHGLAVSALRARVTLGRLLSKVNPREALEIDQAGFDEARRLGQRHCALLFVTNAAADAAWAGEWNWALWELTELLAEVLEHDDRFLVLARLAVIRAWRGDSIDGLVDEMERLAGARPDPTQARLLAEARASRSFALGDLAEAAWAYRQLAQTDSSNAPTNLTMAARTALLTHDVASAAADLETLEATGGHGAWFEARRTSIRAGLAALDGHPTDALTLYGDAMRQLHEIGAALDEAFTAIEMATLLDPAESEVRAAGEVAHKIVRLLQAAPFVTRLDTALARSSARAGLPIAGSGARP